MKVARKVLDFAIGDKVTIREYANRYGLSYKGVWLRLKKYGCPEGRLDKDGNPKKSRGGKRIFIETGGVKVSLKEYARALGVSVCSLYRFKKKYGNYTDYIRYKRMKRSEPQTYGTLNGERVALRRWAEENGESFSSVFHWAQRHGWDISDYHKRKKQHRRPKIARLDGAEENMV